MAVWVCVCVWKCVFVLCEPTVCRKKSRQMVGSNWDWPQQSPPPFRHSQDCYCRNRTSCSAGFPAAMKESNITTLRPPPGRSALASNCMNLSLWSSWEVCVLHHGTCCIAPDTHPRSSSYSWSKIQIQCSSCILTPPERMLQCRLLQAVQSFLSCPVILILSGSCVTWPLTFDTSSILKVVTGYFLECHGPCWDSCCCFCLLLGPTKRRTAQPKLPHHVAGPPRDHRATSARSNNHLISMAGDVD